MAASTQDLNAIKKARFDAVWDMIKAAGFGSDIHPEESKIRLEQPILNGKGQYIFDLKSDAVDNVVTHSLDRNDVFVPNSIGVLISLVNNTTGVETLYPYAPVVADGKPSVHAAGFVDEQVEALYAGYLSWRIDNTVALSAYPMEKFRHVPQVQGAFVLNSSDEAVNEGIKSEWGLDEALTLLMPRYTIAGTRDHKMEVNFNAAGLTFGVTEGYTAKLVLFMDGFLVKGGCQYKGGTGTNPFQNAVGQW